MTALLPLQAHDRVAVVGISGTGKSNFAKRAVAAELEKRGARVVVFDPEDEWSQQGRASAQVRLGPLADRVTAAEFFRDPSRWLGAERLSLAIVPHEDEDRAGEEFADFVELVEHAGDVLVGVEEAGSVLSESSRAQKAAVKLAKRGRHWGCPSLWVSQRMVDIPIGARAQLTQLVTFTQTQEADIAALADRVSREFAARVSHLPAGESLYWCIPTREEGKKS